MGGVTIERDELSDSSNFYYVTTDIKDWLSRRLTPWEYRDGDMDESVEDNKNESKEETGNNGQSETVLNMNSLFARVREYKRIFGAPDNGTE